MNIDTNHRVAIVADDLTSAADAAAPFVVRGLTAIVGRGRPPHLAGTVVSVDCGSRSATRAEAAARVADLTSRLADCEVLFKTVDSTLRGHVTSYRHQPAEASVIIGQRNHIDFEDARFAVRHSYNTTPSA